MAILDPRNDSVVVRIVYDGAPQAGKTTSVRALGQGLGARVRSPAEMDGRTLYFDWLDYTGGLFEGHRIRCQIVSVPGQATLAPRRRRLLESADAVVFVSDTSGAGFEADRRYLSGLKNVLRGLRGPPIGIVLQANKRDLPDAVEASHLRAMLDELDLPVAVIESVATEGSGIREAFVFAVRLALDRAREQMRTQELTVAAPAIDTSEALLKELQRHEDGALDLAVDAGLRHTRLHDLHETVSVATAPSAPLYPDAHVASGLVWPPVDGRIILHEAANAQPQLEPLEHGGWDGTASKRWRFHSDGTAEFESLEQGRAELIEWARMHSAGTGVLSRDRCIALVPAANRRFRLWQVVKLQTTLRDRLEQALGDTTASLAHALYALARGFVDMAQRVTEAPCDLPLKFADIAFAHRSGATYVGLAPNRASHNAQRPLSEKEIGDAFCTELGFAAARLLARRDEFLPSLAYLVRGADMKGRPEWRLLKRTLFTMRA